MSKLWQTHNIPEGQGTRPILQLLTPGLRTGFQRPPHPCLAFMASLPFPVSLPRPPLEMFLSPPKSTNTLHSNPCGRASSEGVTQDPTTVAHSAMPQSLVLGRPPGYSLPSTFAAPRSTWPQHRTSGIQLSFLGFAHLLCLKITEHAPYSITKTGFLPTPFSRQGNRFREEESQGYPGSVCLQIPNTASPISLFPPQESGISTRLELDPSNQRGRGEGRRAIEMA